MEETDPTTTRARARVGTLLGGRWHLDKLIGMGGMAAVYAATHRNSKRVAVKILHPELSVDDNARQRFLREGYAANQVGHRGAVAADDDGTTEDGVTFLVMELLEGETVEERSIRHGRRLPAKEALALIDQALATLEAAHDKGIVHRDLKPENLFLTREGVVKVLDFGIARVSDKFGKSPSQTQGVMGTPSFMAPEQARGRWEEVDARTDLWALGATLFTLLSGRAVHDAETANEALVMAVTHRAPPLLLALPEVHPAVAALVDKSLMYERELRFQSAREFRAALGVCYQTLAGDESLPSLSVPASNARAVTAPGELALTTEGGIAASVRFAAPTRAARTPRSWKAAPWAIAAAAVALGALAGPLLGGHEAPGLQALPGQPSSAAHGASQPPQAAPIAPDSLQPVITPASATAALPVTASQGPAPIAVVPAPAHPMLTNRPRLPAHGAATLATALAPAPTAKTSADLFKKRH